MRRRFLARAESMGSMTDKADHIAWAAGCTGTPIVEILRDADQFDRLCLTPSLRAGEREPQGINLIRCKRCLGEGNEDL
jgi:hypothetical protein